MSASIQALPSQPDDPGERIRLDELVAQVSRSVTARLARDTIDPDDLPAAVQRMTRDAISSFGQAEIMAGRAPLGAVDSVIVARRVRDAVLGLGPVQALLAADDIDNVELIGTAVHVQYADGSWEHLPAVFASDADLQAWVRQQATRAPGDERRFDRGSPAVSVRLPDGSRMFAVTEVSAATSVSIRRHRFLQTSLTDLCLDCGTLSPAMLDLCEALVRARFNLVIAGGMNTGKTTLLRALAAAIPPWERLVTAEQAFELGLHEDPRHANTVALQARAANLEGVGEIRLADQVDWSKQMNASRVIVGEVRGPEVVPMIDAMSLGCDGSMATVHASGSEEALHRLQLYAARADDRLPFDVSAALIGMAVHIVIHLAFSSDGRRVVSSIREVTGADGNAVTSNEIYRPGPDGRGLYTVPPRERTVRALRAVGFDPARLDADRHRWSS